MVEILNSTGNGTLNITKIVASGLDNRTFSALTSSLIIPRLENFTSFFNMTR